MNNPWFIGIISGLICYIITSLIFWWYKTTFIPWLDNKLYKGTRIAGIWQTTMIIDGVVKNESATLEQNGNRVIGTIDYAKDTQGKSHKYKVEGKFQDGILILLQEEIGPKRQDLGAIVLYFKQGGASPIMEGLGVWSDEGKIVAVPYKWIAT